MVRSKRTGVMRGSASSGDNTVVTGTTAGTTVAITGTTVTTGTTAVGSTTRCGGGVNRSLIEGVKFGIDNIVLQGREKETRFLFEELENVRNNAKTCSLILITGLSGTGKTTLVQQLQPRVLITNNSNNYYANNNNNIHSNDITNASVSTSTSSYAYAYTSSQLQSSSQSSQLQSSSQSSSIFTSTNAPLTPLDHRHNHNQHHHHALSPTTIVPLNESATATTATTINITTDQSSPRPGIYCSGKFNEKNRVNARAFRNALGRLCDAIMEHPDLPHIRAELHQKLKSTSVMCTAVDGLWRVLGLGGGSGSNKRNSRNQSLLRESSSTAFKRGFEQLKWGIREFLRVVCKPNRPCVILVDDLQAASIPSIELIKFVAKANIPGLMLIGTYRKDEINVLHPLTTHLTHELTGSTKTIEIGNLKQHDINKLLSALIDRNQQDTSEFAEVLFQKCHGNCFWTIEFLKLLMDDEYLYFSKNTYKWEWDLEAIRNDTCVADNVVSFMVTKLQRLPPETLECLEAGSCLGHKFDVEAIESVIQHTSIDDIHERLKVALQEGLVTRRQGKNLYRFAHDRIMEASYLVLELDEQRRDSMHWNIGKYLKSQLNSVGQIWRILVAAEQMNLASSKYCHALEDKIELVQLNLEAAKAARVQHVYVTAAKFVDAALELFKDDIGYLWTHHRDIALELFDLGAHLQVTVGENERAIEMVDAMLNNTGKLNDLEKAKAQCIRLEIVGGQMRHKEAIEQTGEIVRSLGFHFPHKPRRQHVVGELLKVKIKLKHLSYRDLVTLPETEDTTTRIVMWCLSRGILYGYDAQDDDFTGICILKLAKICMTHGVCLEATLGFQMLGLYLSHMGGFDRCYELGKVALQLQERFTDRRDGLTSAYAYFFNYHIRHPLTESLEPLLSCYEGSMEYGDPTEAHISAYLYTCCYFDLGLPLQHILNDAKSFEKEAEFYGRQLSIKPINSIKAALSMLMGELDTIDEKGYLAQALKEKDVLLYQTFWAKELYAYVYLGDWENCKRVFDSFEKEKKVCTAKYCTGFMHFDFLRGVTAFVLSKGGKKVWYRIRARRFLKQFEDYVVKNKLGNAQHLYAILLAMDSWINRRGSPEKVKACWDSAIRLSARGGYIHQTALANELAAQFSLEENEKFWSNCYMEEAHERYTQWGADEKINRLEDGKPWRKSIKPPPRTSNPVYRSGRFGRERYRNMMKLHSITAFNMKFMKSQKEIKNLPSNRSESIVRRESSSVLFHP